MTAVVVANPLRGPGPAAVASASPTAFHQKFADYRPSPLFDLPAVAAAAGVGQVLVKDESDRLGLPAFKMLGAAWASYRALVEVMGAEPEWSTLDELGVALAPLRPMALATATDGNHGRAVAAFARRVGLEARIFVPEGTSEARIDAIVEEGASCEVVAGSYEDAVGRAAKEAGPRCLVVSDTSWEGYETTPAHVIEGYATIFAEVDEQLTAAGLAAPDAVVVPMGVGALAAAVAQWYRRPGLVAQPVLVGVEPTTANCVQASAVAGGIVEVPGPHRSIMAGLNCGLPSPVAWPWVSSGFDWFVTVDDDDAMVAMRVLADAGIVSGETGAAALAALQASPGPHPFGLSPEATVLLLSTEGATDPDFYTHAVGRTEAEVASGAPLCLAGAPHPGACPVPRCPGTCR